MTEPSTDSDLVRRVREGESEAFGLLYDRTVRLVRAVAADAGPAQADDVTHDTYLRAFRNLDTLQDPNRFAAWLVGIARLIVRERRRSRRFEPLTADLAARSFATAPDPDEIAELLAAVARLPADERLAIRFFFLNEQSIEATARLLDRSRSGTYALLRSARTKLARWLTECGVNS